MTEHTREREEFEAYMRTVYSHEISVRGEHSFFFVDHTGKYDFQQVNGLWMLWQHQQQRIQERDATISALEAALQASQQQLAEKEQFHADAMIEIAKALGADVADEPRCKHVVAIARDVVQQLEASQQRERELVESLDRLQAHCLVVGELYTAECIEIELAKYKALSQGRDGVK